MSPFLYTGPELESAPFHYFALTSQLVNKIITLEHSFRSGLSLLDGAQFYILCLYISQCHRFAKI